MIEYCWISPSGKLPNHLLLTSFSIFSRLRFSLVNLALLAASLSSLFLRFASTIPSSDLHSPIFPSSLRVVPGGIFFFFFFFVFQGIIYLSILYLVCEQMPENFRFAEVFVMWFGQPGLADRWETYSFHVLFSSHGWCFRLSFFMQVGVYLTKLPATPITRTLTVSYPLP